MAGSDLSVRGGHHGEQEPPVARAELHQLENSLLEAMERMFNEHLPTAGGRGPHHEESGDENSGFRGHDRCRYKPAQGWPDLHDSRFKNKDNFTVNSG